MESKPPRADRADSTRKNLLRHASRLFAQKGYADASTDEMVRRAKLTKGALYHHFANKLELYRAVVEDMESELVARMDAAVEACPDPGSRIRAACHAYLDACLDAKLARILIIEAPVILGWKPWCDLAQEHEVATLARRLGEAMATGVMREQPLETMAQVLLGALNNAARVIATSEKPEVARQQVEETVERLLRGLGLPDIGAYT